MYLVYREPAVGESRRPVMKFRPGVAGEESCRDPPDIAAKVGRKAIWVAALYLSSLVECGVFL